MRLKQNGFTIVEILVVIAVLILLALIFSLVYTGLQARTQETSVRHDMKNISRQVEVYAVDNGRYPSAAQLQIMRVRVNKKTYGVNPVGATIFYCTNDEGSEFSIVARVKSSLILRYNSIEAQVDEYAGSTTAPQLCLDSGVPGTTSTVNYTGFTESGAWYGWVLG